MLQCSKKEDGMVTPPKRQRPAAPRSPVRARGAKAPVAVAVEDRKPGVTEITATAATSDMGADALDKASQTEGAIVMTDAMETAKTYAEEAKTRFQGAFSEFNDKTKLAVEKSSRAFEELSELAKGNLEALVESGQIAAKGVETLGQDAAEYGRKSFEKTSTTLRSFAAVKSPSEFFQLQSELLSSMFDTMASESARSSETMLKLAGDIAKPISNRVSVVSDKIKSLAA